MSERGTFVTSFLYDERLAPILRATLVRVARPGSFVEMWPDGPLRAFAGVMHGGYGGEESISDMPWIIEEEILPALAKLGEHGQFSIVVMPEQVDYTRLFVFSKGEVTDYWLNTERGRRMSEPLPEPGPRQNISDMARTAGLTPKPE